jgi:hypothetical protein
VPQVASSFLVFQLKFCISHIFHVCHKCHPSHPMLLHLITLVKGTNLFMCKLYPSLATSRRWCSTTGCDCQYPWWNLHTWGRQQIWSKISLGSRCNFGNFQLQTWATW